MPKNRGLEKNEKIAKNYTENNRATLKTYVYRPAPERGDVTTRTKRQTYEIVGCLKNLVLKRAIIK